MYSWFIYKYNYVIQDYKITITVNIHNIDIKDSITRKGNAFTAFNIIYLFIFI